VINIRRIICDFNYRDTKRFAFTQCSFPADKSARSEKHGGLISGRARRVSFAVFFADERRADEKIVMAIPTGNVTVYLLEKHVPTALQKREVMSE